MSDVQVWLCFLIQEAESFTKSHRWPIGIKALQKLGRRQRSSKKGMA